ncbi:MAG: DNA alkylation repair protein [Acidobacteriota bacterium]|nr:DNA alkylation repair protein [Acidobacteriota bacterium]MDH3528252.1 DNA alkylation repair protein [Acidobacteriota bacterium]
MTRNQVLKELKAFGSEATKRQLMKRGAREPIFGVKVADMKTIAKKIKGDQALALDLYESGNGDAMYLAGLVADGGKMTKTVLRKWARDANWHMIAEYTVPWVAAESKHGWDLALEWIDSGRAHVASAGWATIGSLVATRPDGEMDLGKLKSLLKRVEKEIHSSPNRVRYTMNGFVIAAASYVKALTADAVRTAKAIGKVEVEMDGTACKVPFAPEYIEKIKKRGAIGKKRKTAKC